MRREPRIYLVAYDVSDARRLRLVYKIMRGFGDHLQYSVFRCILSDVQLERMRARLIEAVKHDEDQVLILLLGAAKTERSWRAETIGRPLTHPERVARVF